MEVVHDETVCEAVDEEVCSGQDSTGQEVCKIFPKQVCEIRPVTKTEHMPETSCKKLQTEICGPEACPLTKKDPVCYDEIKEVGLTQIRCSIV